MLYILEVNCAHCCFRDGITINHLPYNCTINQATKCNFYITVPFYLDLFFFECKNNVLHILWIHLGGDKMY